MNPNSSKITTGGILRYVKKAFLFHWNLLALGAGVAYGFLSGRPDVALPLVAAAEIVFLAGLATRPRFQDAVDAQDHQSQRGALSGVDENEATRLISALSQKDRRDFEDLRSLCLELGRIAARDERPADVAQFQTDGVNRLLWIYLKLLFSKTALERYFRTVDEAEIEDSVKRAGERLTALGPESEDDEKEAAYRKSLEDTRATSNLRLANYRKARDNHDFIGIELERLHGKIAGLAELGVGGQGARLFSTEIDAAAATIRNTERAMDELSFLTGLSTDEMEPPRLLNRG